MSGYRFIEIGLLILLAWVAVYLTFPFEERYDKNLCAYSREPTIRIVLGISLILISAYSLPIALLLFLIVFFWIADIHLVSSIKF